MAIATTRLPWHRRHPRLVFALFSELVYVTMWFVVLCCSFAVGMSSDDFDEMAFGFLMTMFVGTIWGHIAWCIVIARRLPKPRPADRIAFLGIVTLVLVVISVVVVGIVGALWVMALAPSLGAAWASGATTGSPPGAPVAHEPATVER